ncbi:hypothetical protein PUN28_011290 [Cardiocondyla obscurior]|uniref:Uncharacterized protein n=1 Tax=Cardiocondyla obscurior TaxID=286306 RepID=A0AAW2FIG4_9HYME
MAQDCYFRATIRAKDKCFHLNIFHQSGRPSDDLSAARTRIETDRLSPRHEPEENPAYYLRNLNPNWKVIMSL